MRRPFPVPQNRQRLPDLAEKAQLLGKPVVIRRGKQLLAAIIGAAQFRRILELVERYDPALADTLAIQTNIDIQAIFEEDEKHILKGELVPIEEAKR